MRAMKVGDVVQLQSGGPAMTVTQRFEAKTADEMTMWRCVYYADGRYGELLVPEVALALVRSREE